MSNRDPQPVLSDPQVDQLQQYRSLSGLAVVAALFGLLSVVALVHPAAWTIPLVAVICGLLGLRKITRHPDYLTGTGWAATGLLLGLLFLCWAPSRYVADRWLLSQQAQAFTEAWLTAVFSGDFGKAYQATLPVKSRQPQGTDLQAFYQQDVVASSERDAYFQKDLAQQLAELAGDGSFTFDRNMGIVFGRDYALISPRYYIYRDGKPDPVLHLQLDVIRESDEEGVYWTVVDLVDAAEVDRRLRARS